MKLKLLIVCSCLCLAATSLRAAGEHPYETITANFFPPELVMQFHDFIGLTDEQANSLKGDLQKVQEQMKDLQLQLKQETDVLAFLTKSEHVDEKAAQDQAGKMVDLESRMRRLQLGILIKIKNTLTTEQQAELTGLKKLELQAKVQKAMELAQQWQEDGRDLSEIHDMRDEFVTDLKARKFTEAEAVADKALKLLEAKEGK